jgi:predicted DNA-binding WGR domain protein
MNIEYAFVGWCRDSEKNQDKVWVAINLDHSRYVILWGRRGKKLQHKIFSTFDSSQSLPQLISSKEKKGYTEISVSKLNTVYPEFQDDLEKTTVWALLTV